MQGGRPELSRDITWKLLKPYGQSAAMQSMGSVAAPLLAGFAISTALLVLQVYSSLKWPDTALAFLMLASILFVTSLQASFNARRFYVPPDEWVEWLNLTTTDARHRQLENNLAGMLPHHDRWIEAARVTYNVGIIVLFAALAVALVPESDPTLWRKLAIAIPALGAVGELMWTVAGQVALWNEKTKSKSRARAQRHPVRKPTLREVAPGPVAVDANAPATRPPGAVDDAGDG